MSNANPLEAIAPALGIIVLFILFALFAAAYIYSGVWAYHDAESRGKPGCLVAFLVLAWFWLLSPTQNPWYWTWALPLVMRSSSAAEVCHR